MNYNSKLQFLERIFGSCKFSSKSNEAEFYCPFCFHHKKKLSINLETDYWKCWVCEKAGKSLYSLLNKFGSSEDTSEYTKKFKASKEQFLKNTTLFKVQFPKEHISLADSNLILAKRAKTYLYQRGYTDEDILKFKLGFCIKGDFKDRIILPSFDRNGNLNFFTGRSLDDEAYIKYLNPLDVPNGYKDQIIFNELNIDYSKPVVITEGFFDMMKSVSNTIPLFGSSLSKESQTFQTLVRRQCEIILALDADAMKKTLKIAKMFLMYDIPVYYVDINPYKDLGSMSKEEFQQKYQQKEAVDSKFIFRRKLWQTLE